MSSANASDGILTAHPYLKGEHLQDIKGKKGLPLGQEIMRTATEGKIDEVTYWWPRPGSDEPLARSTLFSRRSEIKTAESGSLGMAPRGKPYSGWAQSVMVGTQGGQRQ